MNSNIRSHKKALFVLLTIIVVLGAITYSFIGSRGYFSGLQNDLKAINPSEEFSYTDLDGNPVNLTSFRGKPLIINSWASWMPFSQTELPLLAKIKQEQGDTLNILAINRMEHTGVIKAYLSAFSIPTTLVFLADPTDNFYKVVGGYAMPETVFYDADGILVTRTRGTLTEKELRDIVAGLVAEE